MPARAPSQPDTPGLSSLLGSKGIGFLPDETLAVAVVRRPDLLPASVRAPLAGLLLSDIGSSEPGAPATTSIATGPATSIATGPATGIARERPAGIALVDGESTTLVSFAEVADEANLEAFLRARYPGLTRSVGDAGAIFSLPAEKVGFVVRDGYVFMVRSLVRSKRERIETRLASAQASGSLGDSARFAAVVTGPGAGRDLGIYLAADRIGRELVRADEDLAAAMADQAAEARARLAEARGRGVAMAELTRLARAARDEDRRASSIQAYAARRAELARQLVGGWGSFALGANLDGGNIALSLRAMPGAGGWLARLRASGRSGVPSFRSVRAVAQPRTPGEKGATTLPPRAAFDLAAAMDAGALLELLRVLDLIAAPLDVELAEPQRHLDQRLGMDLDRELVPLLAGPIRLALDGPCVPGLHLAIDVTDMAGAQALLTRLAAPQGVAPSFPARAPGLDVGGQKVAVALRGQSIVVSAAASPSPGSAGSVAGSPDAHQQADPALAGLAGGSRSTGAVASLVMEGVFLAELLAGQPLPRLERGTLPEDDNEDVPLSAAYRALAAELAAANARIDEILARLAALDRERTRAIAEPFGALHLELTTSGQHVLGRGQVILHATDVATALAEAARRDASFTGQREALLGSASELQARLTALHKELLQTRARDVQAWDLQGGGAP